MDTNREVTPGMTVEQASEQVLTRIGFTERWLQRARSQVAAGNLPRGILTLVLADAEVRHALEAAGATSVRVRRRIARLAPVGFAAIVLAAVAAVAVGTVPGDEPALAADPAPRIVTLSSRTGELLNLIPLQIPTGALAPASRSPASVRTAVRGPARSRVRAPEAPQAAPQPVPASRSTDPGHPQAGSAAPASGAPQGAAVAVQTGPTPGVQLTLGDFIDLVLAAERTLRSNAAGR